MVDRCVCHDVTFAELQALSRTQAAASVERLAELTGCGTGCGCCVPYIRLMLKAGQTRFPVLSLEAFRRLGVLEPVRPEPEAQTPTATRTVVL